MIKTYVWTLLAVGLLQLAAFQVLSREVAMAVPAGQAVLVADGTSPVPPPPPPPTK